MSAWFIITSLSRLLQGRLDEAQAARHNQYKKYENQIFEKGPVMSQKRVTKLVRAQDRGQITLPIEVRKKYGIKEGDLVGFRETKEGLLIDLRAVQIARALDQIGAALKEQGETLGSMLESGREIRGKRLKELYGIESADDPPPRP
jgi:AbrB family looped-hinge helix DNA binding protein